MSQQIALSDLIVDLSTDEQQLLAGGQFMDDGSEDDSLSRSLDDSKDGSGSFETGTTRVYRVRSTGIVRVRRVR